VAGPTSHVFRELVELGADFPRRQLPIIEEDAFSVWVKRFNLRSDPSRVCCKASPDISATVQLSPLDTIGGRRSNMTKEKKMY
jgi:hypothetical protein